MTAVIIIGVIVAILVIIYIANYNGLVGLRNQTKNAWAQIDVQLKRRYDLIPNLIETVKGYAGHERNGRKAAVVITDSAGEDLSSWG
jgi:LemA protein